MAIMPRITWKREDVKLYEPIISEPLVKEEFKGQVLKEEVKFPKDLGEEHPFNFSYTEGLYKKFGFVTGVVDKLIDFVVGPGFFIKTENEVAKKLIEKFLQDNNFDTILRAWVKEALIKGSGFLEVITKNKEPVAVKVLDAKWMYLRRDEKGNVLNYNQLRLNARNKMVSSFVTTDFISFKPDEIAFLSLNKVGDAAYGMGIIAPAMNKIEQFLKAEDDMHVLLHRKANAPIHAKLGTSEKMPSAASVTAFGQKLETFHNKHEWATDALVDMKVLDFGNIAGKFDPVLKHDSDMLFFTFQVPEVLMGRGDIPEGLARVQMDAFERRVQSLQSEIEKVVEAEIFKRILNANGLDVHVELEWGQPSNTEKNERITKLTEMMKIPMLSFTLRDMLEKEVAKLFGFNVKELETPEEEREKEEKTPLPIIPGQNQRREVIYDNFVEGEKVDGKIKCGSCQGESEGIRYCNDFYSCESCGAINLTEKEKDYALKEWLNFNYQEYLSEILTAIDKYGFNELKALSAEELAAGKFTSIQVARLKSVLEKSFIEGKTIRELSEEIDSKVKPKNLYRMRDGKLDKGKSGEPILQRSGDLRSIMIARTESTRMANMGAIEHFKNQGVKELVWVASYGDRTCPYCLSLDGRIFEINHVPSLPAHVGCRCTTVNLER